MQYLNDSLERTMMTISEKTDAVVMYFTDRQKLDCIKTADDKISLKLFQWNDVHRVLKIKPTDDISRFLNFNKEDLEGADFVLFILEKFAWSQAYAIECKELQNHLKEDGTGEVDVTSLPAPSYMFFDLMKANKYFKKDY